MNIFYIISNIADESRLRIQKLIRNRKLRVCAIEAAFRINFEQAFSGVGSPLIEAPTMTGLVYCSLLEEKNIL